MTQVAAAAAATKRVSQITTEHACRVCVEPIIGSHVNANNDRFHQSCFVCCQCLEPFPENIFFEAGGRYYCDFDYTVLYGARCGRCGEIIRGKCLTALDMKWHPEHFTCDQCGKPLAGTTFVKKNNKPYCKPCVERLKRKIQEIEYCERCKKPLNERQTEFILIINEKKYHSHHFNCSLCKETLGADCREYESKLYCSNCLERITTRVCQACRRPIQGRSITAMGKQYHPEHFVCSRCEKPFGSSVYWEYKGKPYCELHYREMVGEVCGLCYEPVLGKTISAMGRPWCENHFVCTGCHGALLTDNNKMQFWEYDLKPFCKKCFDALPTDIRRRMAKFADMEKKAAAANAK
ncbi:hypothetical protein DFS34DRAFT_214499 [Phlyctochytrium arcticum]|nr:hypothetical protein DFS34DRAFT_214499 [Phlyctochytrium arcticum]